MNITFHTRGFTFNAEVKASPIVPAKTWGPPETCYPEEGGELEIENLVLEEGDLLELLFLKNAIEVIQDAAYKAAMEQARDE